MGNKSTKQKNDSSEVIGENDVNKGSGEDHDESVVQKMKSKLEKVMESLETKPQESVVENGSDSSPLIGNGIQPDKKDPEPTENNTDKEAENKIENNKEDCTKPEDTNGTEDAKVNGSAVVGTPEETESIKNDEKPIEGTEAATNNSEEGDAKKEETIEPSETNNSEESEAKEDKPTEGDKTTEDSNKVDEEADKDKISLKEQADGEQKEKDDSAVAKEE